VLAFLLKSAGIALMLLGGYYIVRSIVDWVAKQRERRNLSKLEDSVMLGKGTVFKGDDVGKFFDGELRLDHQVYVRIPEPLDPVERGRRYAEPLDAALTNAGIGEITGGGTMATEFCGLDVTLRDFNKGVALLKLKLRQLNAPRGTVIEFECGEIPVYDET